jgi:hypothetical protein
MLFACHASGIKEFCMKKNTIVLGLLLAAAALFTQTEADFDIDLTQDGKGLIIMKYKGLATAVKIPASFEGMSVQEID